MTQKRIACVGTVLGLHSGISEYKINAFLHALSSVLIDAIPLSVLSKLRNFLWLGGRMGFGTTKGRTGGGEFFGAVCV